MAERTQLSNRLKDKVALYCYAMVSGRFADMCCITNQGKLFNWTHFSESMAKHCAANIFLYFDNNQKNLSAITEYAGTIGAEIADTLATRLYSK
jgi:hypothetical protein